MKNVSCHFSKGSLITISDEFEINYQGAKTGWQIKNEYHKD